MMSADTTVVFDLSADAGTMASLCESGDIVLLNATSGQTIRTLVANAATPIVSLRWNSDATGLLVTRRNGTVTNETYPQTREFDGGFCVLELPSREAAIHWAAKIAHACRCSQELREFGYDPES